MPSKTVNARALTRQTVNNQKELVPLLIKGKKRIESAMLGAARDKRFGTVRKVRDQAYANLAKEYYKIQGNLDGWTQDSIKRTGKEFHGIAASDLKQVDGIKTAGIVQFSEKHFENYFELIHPFNAERLAAVNVQLNPQLGKMLASDVRELQTAVVEVFREAEVAGLTADQRFRELRNRLIGTAESPKSWAFIDVAGQRWKPGNYFDMLNRTVSANVARQSYNDTLIDEGRDLVRIVGGLSSNSNDACIEWVGRIVSLTGSTPGFPLLDEYVAAGGFHPNCVHTTVYVSEREAREG